MPLTNAGRNFIASRIIGATQTAFDNTDAYIGVGDSTTAFDPTQVDLQATTNKLRKGMDNGYPTIATNVLTFESTYGPNDANFTWNEWGVFNASAGGTMLNRLVQANGTKLSGQTWVFQVAITVNIGQ